MNKKKKKIRRHSCLTQQAKQLSTSREFELWEQLRLSLCITVCRVLQKGHGKMKRKRRERYLEPNLWMTMCE